MTALNLAGQVFGRLRVLRRAPTGPRSSAYWECECACGNLHIATSPDLRGGHTKSCGCLRKENGTRTHGMTKTPTYFSWVAMKYRCKDKTRNVASYAAKGITYCPEWESFDRFYADMGDKPPGTSIDRINNALGYFKENCRWATNAVQNANRDSTRWVEWRGDRYPLTQLSVICGISRTTFKERLNRGWTVERAMTVPPDERRLPKAARQSKQAGAKT